MKLTDKATQNSLNDLYLKDLEFTTLVDRLTIGLAEKIKAQAEVMARSVILSQYVAITGHFDKGADSYVLMVLDPERTDVDYHPPVIRESKGYCGLDD